MNRIDFGGLCVKKPTVVDIFCGIGGFSRGFETAGFDSVVGIDNWDVAMDTFKRNHRNVQTIIGDVKKLDEKDFKKIAQSDVVIAGPPCQGFSMSGKRDPNDIRNTLFEQVVRVVSKVSPKIVVIENVVGLLSMRAPQGRMVKDVIYEKLEEMGYTVEHKVLDASEYGVPQSRKRVIFIASRIGPVGFPPATHSAKPSSLLFGSEQKKRVTVGDALSNIPDIGKDAYLKPKNDYQELMASERLNKIYNHERVNHGSSIVKRMSLVPKGGNWKDIPPEHYGVGGNHSNNYRRLDPDKPSVTLKHANKSMIIHPEHDRSLSVREVARLQSFDDSFILEGNKYDQHQQLANAVPPLLGFAIARHIKRHLWLRQKAEKKKAVPADALRFIDLFSGIGGFRVALEKAQCRCVFSSENDPWASETYEKNFHEVPAGDITKIDEKNIPSHDILCAGFPCQPFSIGGHRKGFKDTRGTLFFHVARILAAKKPGAFILENVPGITTHDGGNTIETIRKVLDDVGYEIFEKKIDAKDFGLPQNRPRWFCVGFRKDLGVNAFEFPEGFKLRRSVFEMLEENVEGHEITRIAAKNIKQHLKDFKKSNGGYTLASEIRPSKCTIRDDGISPCLTAKMGTGGNNVPVVVELGRKLTVSECLRLMGFEGNFKIRENNHQSYKQIGNSVAVPIVSSIASKVVEKIT